MGSARIFAPIILALGLGATVFAAGNDKTALADETEPRNWPSYGRTHNETHFSPLTLINRDTVGQLRLAWSVDLGGGTALSTPLAIDGVVYVASGYSVVHAVEATRGKVLWKFDPEAAQAANQKLRGGAGIRGLAFFKGRLFVGTQDGRLIALDAKTGAVAWTATVLDPADRSFISGAPRVCGDKVVIGSGAAPGDVVRGRVTAHDAASGNEAWRWWSVPEGAGGGAVWNAITCDPVANRVYVGVGESRGAAAAGPYVTSVVALDARSGAPAWSHKADAGTPADASLDITLATLPVDGTPRRVLLHAPKDGFVYVLDRETGRRISARKLDAGAHTLAAQAFSPRTGLLYLPTSVPADASSALTAWDPVKQRSLWSIPNPGPNGGGVLATAGDVVLQGQMDGYVNGFDAASGRKVWSFYAATAVLGAPITFMAGSQQYVALLAGPPGGTPANLGAASAKFGWDSRLHPRRLLAFSLAGTASLPATPGPTPAKPLDGPEVAVEEAFAKEGAEKYTACAWCHGAGAIAAGMAPDLRASAVPLNAAAFSALVKAGVEAKGMPKFAELGDRDLEALRHFIRASARLVTRPDGVAPPPPEAPPAQPAIQNTAEPAEQNKPPGSLESSPPPQ
jgi:quinohemoprotein ethanol dehydrogenase